MNDHNQIPLWLDIVVKLTPAFVTSVLGGFGFWLAWRQHKIQNDKLRLDLFEKRLDAYEKLQEFFSHMLQHAVFDERATVLLHEARYKSRFLFDDGIRSHVEKLWEQGFKMRELRRKMYGPDALPVGPERSAVCEKESAILKWIMDQMVASQERFARYLEFR